MATTTPKVPGVLKDDGTWNVTVPGGQGGRGDANWDIIVSDNISPNINKPADVKTTDTPPVVTSRTPTTATANRFWSLQFSSESNSAAFGLDKNNTDPGDKKVANTVIALKDDAVPKPSFLLADVLKNFGIDEVKEENVALQTILSDKILDKKTTMCKVDSSPAKKSAIWFVPGDAAHQFNIKVSFTIDARPSLANKLATEYINKEFGLNMLPLMNTDLNITLQQQIAYNLNPVRVSDAKKVWKMYMSFPIAGFDVWLTFATKSCTLNLTDPAIPQSVPVPALPSLFKRLGDSVFRSSSAPAVPELKDARIADPIKPNSIQSFFMTTPDPALWAVKISKEEVKSEVVVPADGRPRSNAISGDSDDPDDPVPTRPRSDAVTAAPELPDDPVPTRPRSDAVTAPAADPVPASDAPKVYRIVWEIKYISKLNFSDGKIPLVGLVYNSKDATWTGNLLFATSFPDTVKARLPAWNVIEDVPVGSRNVFVRISSADGILKPNPDGKSPLPESLNIWATFGIDKYKPPDWVPSLLSEGSITYGRTAAGKVTLGLSFTIVAPPKPTPAAKTTTEANTTAATTPAPNTTPAKTPKPSTDGKDVVPKADSPSVPSRVEWQKCMIKILKVKESDNDTEGKTEVAVSALIALNPRVNGDTPSKLTPVVFEIALAYKSDAGVSSWFLNGGVKDLSVGLLHNFVDPSVKDGVMAIVGKLNLKTFNLAMTYSEGHATSFFIFGTLAIGEIKLDLSYQYTSGLIGKDDKTAAEQVWATQKPPGPPGNVQALRPKPKTPAAPPDAVVPAVWAFEAYLGADTAESTIGKVAKSIMGSEVNDLPSFVANIPVGGGKNPAIKLKVTRPDKASDVIFVFSAQIKTLMLTFVQLSSGKGDGTSSPTKKAVRFSCDAFPEIPNIPVMDKMPQPWKELLYLWVSGNGDGLKAADLDSLNKQLTGMNIPNLKYRALTKPPAAAAGVIQDPTQQPATPVVLLAGHHLMVLNNSNEVILDHLFDSKDTTPDGTRPRSNAISDDGRPRSNAISDELDGRPRSNAISEDPDGRPRSNAISEDPDDPDDPDDPVPTRPRSDAMSRPTKGALDVKTSILSISSISFQMKTGGWLAITVDATVTLGPIAFTVVGFELSIHLSSFRLDELGLSILEAINSGSDTFGVSIKGLAVSFEKPPVILAGVFIHDKKTTEGGSEESYRGGIAVSVLPYVFQAVGQYKVITKDNPHSELKSVFVYAQIEGPIVTIYGIATLEGIKLGFGYNSVVRGPSLEEITQNPFISGSGAGNSGANPMKILETMTGTGQGGGKPWVTEKDGAYWFAAGFKIVAAEMLAVSMVALFGFPDGFGSGVIVSLYGDGVAQMPPKAPPMATLIYIEVGMSAEMNFKDGYLLIMASLSPSSHLWVPQCHLTGGAAVQYWFGDNPHSGDFVVTIGGYHPAYTPPSWYPVPKRLGLSFVVGDNIGIRGEAYFAVTPKCAMAGISFHMWMSIGPVGAHLDASADFFVQYKPLFFMGDVSVSIGVTFDMDFLFIHIHIEVDIGARLSIWGPNFGGIAHVDFWMWGFDIRFGADKPDPVPLTLVEFWEGIRSPGPAAGDNPEKDKMKKETDPNIGNLKLAVEDGIFAQPVRTSLNEEKPFPNSGQNSIWSVRGGPFRFRINCDMAVSEARVADVDDEELPVDMHQNPSVDWGKVKPIDKPQGLDQIHSKLMQLKENEFITSTLEVAIFRESAKEVPEAPTDPPNAPEKFVTEYIGVGGWRCEMIVSAVPHNTWGAYNHNDDPVYNKQVIDGADKATMQLCMGLRIQSPQPILAQATIPDFDATAANNQKIGERPLPISRIGDGSDEQTSFLSTGVFQKDDTGPVRWDAMQKKWNSIVEEKQTLALDMLSSCASILGWSDRAPGNEGDEWRLKSDTPTQLIHDLDFRYLELPCVGNGVATAA
jgi:hypothetical protein